MWLWFCHSRKVLLFIVLMDTIPRVWKGILGIRELTKIGYENRENDKYLDGIRDLTAPLEAGVAKISAWGCGIFLLFVGNSGNRHDPN